MPEVSMSCPVCAGSVFKNRPGLTVAFVIAYERARASFAHKHPAAAAEENAKGRLMDESNIHLTRA